jgi:hypothetical protein
MQVAQYRIREKIGKGGMGKVYLADDLVLNRKVAIKFAQTPAPQARFQREAEITALLEHPGVVPVLMRGQQDGRLYYVMRYVEGERFDQAIHSWHKSCQSARDFRRTKVQLQFRELLQRFVAVCQTVAYAHSRGIIHRDLKPNNILLGRFGETIVLDWGLAKRKSEAGSTAAGSRLGTKAYMAPEQVDGKPADERTDVFLLGATLYHLLTGQPPFYRGRPAKPPRQLKPWIPAALQAICCKAMADDPQARYATAEQLAADVKRWLADEPVAVYREPLGQRLARWLRRHRTLAGVAAWSCWWCAVDDWFQPAGGGQEPGTVADQSRPGISPRPRGRATPAGRPASAAGGTSRRPCPQCDRTGSFRRSVRPAQPQEGAYRRGKEAAGSAGTVLRGICPRVGFGAGGTGTPGPCVFPAQPYVAPSGPTRTGGKSLSPGLATV